MNFITKLFGNRTKEANANATPKVLSPECSKILELKGKLSILLNADHYVARSEFAELIPSYKEIIDYFSVLNNSGMLKTFCKQNDISVSDVISTIERYNNLISKIDEANDSFIQRKLV